MKIEIYQSAHWMRDNWYWRAVAHNGKTIADGAEGYANKSNCQRAARRFINRMRSMPEPQIVVL